MLTEKQVATCRKYSARDAEGRVHCMECPLVVDKDRLMCRANSTYDRHKREWDYDYNIEVTR